MPQNYSSCFPANTPPTKYPSPGATQTNFPIGFPYLKESDVVVFKEVSSKWTIVALADYSITGTNVVFVTAPQAPVLIGRRTDICDLVRTFQAGQSIRAEDLNNAFKQSLYQYQEIYEYLSYLTGGGELLPDETSLVVSAGTGINITEVTGPPKSNQISVNQVQIWGKNHNHGASVSGDMNLVGNITFTSGTNITLTPSTTNNITIAGGTSAGDGALQVNRDLVLANAATTQFGGLNYTWPSSQSGTKVLINDGSGNLSWSTTGAAGSDTLQDVCTRGSTTTTGATFGGVVNGLQFIANQIGGGIVASRVSNGLELFRGGSVDFDLADPNTYTSVIYSDGAATFKGYVDCIRNAGNGFGYLGIGPGGTNEKAAFVNRSGEITLEMYQNYSTTPEVTISGDGSASFAGTVETGAINTSATNVAGCSLNNDGAVVAQRTSAQGSSNVFQGWRGNVNTSSITADGVLVLAGTQDDNTVHTVSIKAPTGDANFNTNWTLTLPDNAGISGQILRTDGSGVTSWVSPDSDPIWTKDGTNVHLTTNSDDVGIGTSTPEAKLEVSDAQPEVWVRDTTAAGNANNNGAAFVIARPTGTADPLQTNDRIGRLRWRGSATDADFIGAEITTQVTNGNTNRSNTTCDMIFGTMASGDTGALDKMRLTDAGRLLIGIDEDQTIGGINANLQVAGSPANNATVSVGRYSADASAAFFQLFKSRSNTVDTNDPLEENDIIGRVAWYAADGTTYDEAAHIACEMDADAANNDTPGRLVFATTPSGASNALERMRIASDGNVGIGTVGNNYVQSRLEARATEGGGNTGIRITNNTTDANSKASLMLTATTADFISAALAYDRTSTALGFYVGQASGSSAGDGIDASLEWWRMDNNGNFQSTHTAGAAPVYASTPAIQTGYGWMGDSASGSLALTTNLYRDSSDDAWKHIGSKVDGLRGSMLSLGFGTISGFVAATQKDRGQNAVLTQVFGTTTVGTGSSQRVDFNITKGNIVMESDGTGIDFGAVSGGSGSPTSSILDDYEEGTWTPVATNTGDWSGFASSTVNGYSATYTKVGRAVTIQANIGFEDSTGNLTVGDYVQLGGLPFNYGGSVDDIYNSTSAQVFTRDQTNGGVSQGYLASSNRINARVVAVTGTANREQTTIKLSFTYFTD